MLLSESLRLRAGGVTEHPSLSARLCSGPSRGEALVRCSHIQRSPAEVVQTLPPPKPEFKAKSGLAFIVLLITVLTGSVLLLRR